VRCQAIFVEEVPWGDGKRTLTRAYMLFLARWARKLSWKETAEAVRTSWKKGFRRGGTRRQALDEVGGGESRRIASEGGVPVLKKSRWLLLKREENLKTEQRFRLRDLLRLRGRRPPRDPRPHRQG
jgi:hypothetical protein